MKTEQINLRMHPPLLRAAKEQASRRGFRNVQAFIEDAVRAQVYDPDLTPAEWKKADAALRDVKEGRVIPGDVVLAKMRRLASGKK